MITSCTGSTKSVHASLYPWSPRSSETLVHPARCASSTMRANSSAPAFRKRSRKVARCAHVGACAQQSREVGVLVAEQPPDAQRPSPDLAERCDGDLVGCHQLRHGTGTPVS